MSESMRRARQVVETTDPSVAADAIARTHVGHGVDVDPDGAGFVFEERVRGTRLLSLESTTCTGAVSGTIEPGSAMTLVWLKSGRGHVDGHPVAIGGPVLFRNGPQPVRFEAFQKDVIRIDRVTVEEVAAERGGWAPGPLEFRPRHVPEGPTLAAWWLMVRTVAAEVLTGPDEVSMEREQELTRFAANGLLTAIPHWPVEQPAQQTPASSRFARAEAFLLEHAAEQITVADVAEAAGLSVRGVQAAFNRHHGTTPLAYLRRIRLLLAREQLQSVSDRSIAEIARGAGFAHLGRFAGAYRDEFGELPRHTLRAARG
ncbi:AraC family transcriptional regulator [Curtobacterium sp. VKM Ac-1376]|uniref:AraC family transcriptional regulator n=1 Tax=Curtobacterium sp. VKM Ac-1376 TaxID=123312 RepID=UPI00188CD7C0|nr:AraC family transcriptional regulator [Curtobacterium sp. VKM Ac-1376]MBF4613878.1 helix-turn-helix transcriptional regulator [Curtobacterium sp. VKM Ac-1376]MBF4616425.1 helix-turn-helix transcriptional regulator [Curtobacterium sp. VKM Ac-1376]